MALAKLAVPILLALAGSAAAAPPAPADRAALERLAADNDAAWTAKDWVTITGQYAEGGTLRVGPGEPIHAGRAAIARFFQASFGRRAAGLRHVTRIDHVEMVTPDVAIADGHVRVERATDGGGWSLAREFVSSTIVVRERGHWKLHSVRANPLPAAAKSS